MPAESLVAPAKLRSGSRSGFGVVHSKAETYKQPRTHRLGGSFSLEAGKGWGFVFLRDGDHLAHLYETETERNEVLVDFFRAGIGRGERCLYIASDKLSGSMRRMLPAALDLVSRGNDKELVIGRGSSWGRGGAAAPGRARDLFVRYRKEALDAGFTGLCAVIDMTWALSARLTPDQIAKREALFDTLFTPGSQMVAICQYDRRQFQPQMIPFIFRTHCRILEGKVLSPGADSAVSGGEFAEKSEPAPPASARSRKLRPLPNERRRSPEKHGEERALALAQLSQLALGAIPMGLLLHRSVSLMEQVLETELVEVVSPLSPDHAFEVLAGLGWTGNGATGGDRFFYRRVFESAHPIAFLHPQEELGGSPSSRLRSSGVRSGIAAPIPGRGNAAAILAAYSRQRRTFLPAEKQFVQSVAGVLGMAMERKRVLEEVQGQSATLERILETVEAQPDMVSFLDPVVAAVAERLGASGARLWFHNPLHDTIYVHTLYRKGRILPVEGSGYPTATDPAPVASWPSWQRLFALTRPDIHADFVNEADESERQLSKGDRPRTILRVPLVMGGAVLGGVAASLPDARRFLPADFERIQSLVHYITLVVRLKQLSDHARERAVLEERNRMALEIHDSLAQSLTGIVIHLQAAEKAKSNRSSLSRKHLRLCRILAREGLAEARRSVWALRPGALDENGIPGALKHLATTLFTGSNVRIRLRSHCKARPLNGDVEMDLFRIAQEAMTNVLKHAGATELHIGVSSTEEGVQIRIADNGRGFASKLGPKATTGIGLKGMRERARRAGAVLKIESSQGRGTRVEILRPAKTSSDEKTNGKKANTHSAGR
jgi:signal transduction histidine kinase